MPNVVILGIKRETSIQVAKFLASKHRTCEFARELADIDIYLENRSSLVDLVVVDSNYDRISPYEIVKHIKSKSILTEVVIMIPRENSTLAKGLLAKGAYHVGFAEMDPEVVYHHLQNIQNALDLFEIAQTHCREQLITEMDYRLELASEFVQTRKNMGKLFTPAEWQLFFPATDHDSQLHIEKVALGLLANQEQPKPVVWIIEDEHNFRILLKRMLHKSYSLKMAGTYQEALDLIETQTAVDAVLLDIRLGTLEERGTNLIGPIKNKFPTAQVIMLTAQIDLPTINLSFREGAYDYVTKPYEDRELLPVLARGVQRSFFSKFLPKKDLPLKTSSSLSDTEKLSILQDIARYRLSQDKMVLMKELYFFFPELEAIFRKNKEEPLSATIINQDPKVFQQLFKVELTKTKEKTQ